MQRNIADLFCPQCQSDGRQFVRIGEDVIQATYTAGGELHMGGGDMPRRPAAADGIGEWSRGNGTRGRNRK